MAYVRRNWVDYPSTETPIDADALNNIEDGIEESHNIQLLAVTDTAPSECAEGDKYYDTTTKLIYTATGTDEWGETGETPIYDILYIVLDEQSTYTYDGTDLVSVGGGSGGGANIVNEYSESTTDGYSANYMNGFTEVEEFTSQVTFNERVAGNTHFYKMGKLIVVMLQGETKTHSNADVIATIPVDYRPPNNVYVPFTKNGNAYGSLSVDSTGKISVNQISSTTASGRIYANFSYFID